MRKAIIKVNKGNYYFKNEDEIYKRLAIKIIGDMFIDEFIEVWYIWNK